MHLWHVMKKLAEHNIIQVAAGAMHTLALTREGNVFSWGCNDDGALGRPNPEEESNAPDLVCFPEKCNGTRPTRMIQVSCGDCHSASVDDKGQVWLWGS